MSRLNLSHNALLDVERLGALKDLNVLNLSKNKLTSIGSIVEMQVPPRILLLAAPPFPSVAMRLLAAAVPFTAAAASVLFLLAAVLYPEADSRDAR